MSAKRKFPQTPQPMREGISERRTFPSGIFFLGTKRAWIDRSSLIRKDAPLDHSQKAELTRVDSYWSPVTQLPWVLPL